MCKASREVLDPFERKRKKYSQCGEYPNIPKCGYDELYNRPPSPNQTSSGGTPVGERWGYDAPRHWTDEQYDKFTNQEGYQDKKIAKGTSQSDIEWSLIEKMLSIYDESPIKSTFPTSMDRVKELYRQYEATGSLQSWDITTVREAYAEFLKMNPTLANQFPPLEEATEENIPKDVKVNGWLTNSQDISPSDILIFMGCDPSLAKKIVNKENPKVLAAFLSLKSFNETKAVIDLANTENSSQIPEVKPPQTGTIQTNNPEYNEIIKETNTNFLDFMTPYQIYKNYLEQDEFYTGGKVEPSVIEEKIWDNVVSGGSTVQDLDKDTKGLIDFFNERSIYWEGQHTYEGLQNKYKKHAERIIAGNQQMSFLNMNLDMAYDFVVNVPINKNNIGKDPYDTIRFFLGMGARRKETIMLEAFGDTVLEAIWGYDKAIEKYKSDVERAYGPEGYTRVTEKEKWASMFDENTGRLTTLGQRMWDEGLMDSRTAPFQIDEQGNPYMDMSNMIDDPNRAYQENKTVIDMAGFYYLPQSLTKVNEYGDTETLSPLTVIAAQLDLGGFLIDAIDLAEGVFKGVKGLTQTARPTAEMMETLIDPRTGVKYGESPTSVVGGNLSNDFLKNQIDMLPTGATKIDPRTGVPYGQLPSQIIPDAITQKMFTPTIGVTPKTFIPTEGVNPKQFTPKTGVGLKMFTPKKTNLYEVMESMTDQLNKGVPLEAIKLNEDYGLDTRTHLVLSNAVMGEQTALFTRKGNQLFFLTNGNQEMEEAVRALRYERIRNSLDNLGLIQKRNSSLEDMTKAEANKLHPYLQVYGISKEETYDIIKYGLIDAINSRKLNTSLGSMPPSFFAERKVFDQVGPNESLKIPLIKNAESGARVQTVAENELHMAKTVEDEVEVINQKTFRTWQRPRQMYTTVEGYLYYSGFVDRALNEISQASVAEVSLFFKPTTFDYVKYLNKGDEALQNVVNLGKTTSNKYSYAESLIKGYADELDNVKKIKENDFKFPISNNELQLESELSESVTDITNIGKKKDFSPGADETISAVFGDEQATDFRVTQSSIKTSDIYKQKSVLEGQQVHAPGTLNIGDDPTKFQYSLGYVPTDINKWELRQSELRKAKSSLGGYVSKLIQERNTEALFHYDMYKNTMKELGYTVPPESQVRIVLEKHDFNSPKSKSLFTNWITGNVYPDSANKGKLTTVIWNDNSFVETVAIKNLDEYYPNSFHVKQHEIQAEQFWENALGVSKTLSIEGSPLSSQVKRYVIFSSSKDEIPESVYDTISAYTKMPVDKIIKPRNIDWYNPTKYAFEKDGLTPKYFESYKNARVDLERLPKDTAVIFLDKIDNPYTMSNKILALGNSNMAMSRPTVIIAYDNLGQINGVKQNLVSGVKSYSNRPPEANMYSAYYLGLAQKNDPIKSAVFDIDIRFTEPYDLTKVTSESGLSKIDLEGISDQKKYIETIGEYRANWKQEHQSFVDSIAKKDRLENREAKYWNQINERNTQLNTDTVTTEVKKIEKEPGDLFLQNPNNKLAVGGIGSLGILELSNSSYMNIAIAEQYDWLSIPSSEIPFYDNEEKKTLPISVGSFKLFQDYMGFGVGAGISDNLIKAGYDQLDNLVKNIDNILKETQKSARSKNILDIYHMRKLMTKGDIQQTAFTHSFDVYQKIAKNGNVREQIILNHFGQMKDVSNIATTAKISFDTDIDSYHKFLVKYYKAEYTSKIPTMDAAHQTITATEMADETIAIFLVNRQMVETVNGKGMSTLILSRDTWLGGKDMSSTYAELKSMTQRDFYTMLNKTNLSEESKLNISKKASNNYLQDSLETVIGKKDSLDTRANWFEMFDKQLMQHDPQLAWLLRRTESKRTAMMQGKQSHAIRNIAMFAGLIGTWWTQDNLQFMTNTKIAVNDLRDTVKGALTYKNPSQLIDSEGRLNSMVASDINNLMKKQEAYNRGANIWSSQITIAQYAGLVPEAAGYTLGREDYAKYWFNTDKPTEEQLKEIDLIFDNIFFDAPAFAYDDWKIESMTNATVVYNLYAKAYDFAKTQKLSEFNAQGVQLAKLSKSEQDKILTDTTNYYAQQMDYANSKFPIRIGVSFKDTFAPQFRFSNDELRELRNKVGTKYGIDSDEYIAVSSITGGEWAEVYPKWEIAVGQYGVDPYLIFAGSEELTMGLRGLVNDSSFMQFQTDVMPYTKDYDMTQFALMTDTITSLNNDTVANAKLREIIPIDYEGTKQSIITDTEKQFDIGGKVSLQPILDSKDAIVSSAVSTNKYLVPGTSGFKTAIDNKVSEIKETNTTTETKEKATELNVTQETKSIAPDITKTTEAKKEDMSITFTGKERIAQLETFIKEDLGLYQFSFANVLASYKFMTMLFGEKVETKNGNVESFKLYLGEALPEGSKAFIDGKEIALDKVTTDMIRNMELSTLVMIAKDLKDEITLKVTTDGNISSFDLENMIANSIEYGLTKGVYYSRPYKSYVDTSCYEGRYELGDDGYPTKFREATLGVKENWKERFAICGEVTNLLDYREQPKYSGDYTKYYDWKDREWKDRTIPILGGYDIKQYTKLMTDNLLAQLGNKEGVEVTSWMNVFGDHRASITKAPIYFPGSHQVYNPRTNSYSYHGVPRDENGSPLSMIYPNGSGEGFWACQDGDTISITPGTGHTPNLNIGGMTRDRACGELKQDPNTSTTVN